MLPSTLKRICRICEAETTEHEPLFFSGNMSGKLNELREQYLNNSQDGYQSQRLWNNTGTMLELDKEACQLGHRHLFKAR